jgi:glycosyltransferase involved in cell wall biosynthesis
VPCVATDVGDSKSILGECGTIVPVADPEALAGVCNVLLSQGSGNLAVLGLASRNRIVSTFDIRIVVRQYLHLWFSDDFPVSG